ncbi:MAG: two-component system sensor histidine kinase NtrB [Desulfopila sp.]
MEFTRPNSPPPSPTRPPVSRAITGLLAATAVLTALLIYSTIDNIHRAENHMLDFVKEKGETIIRVLEAGSRAATMPMMGRGSSLHTLFAESSKADDLVFIRLVRGDGALVDQVGYALPTTLAAASLAALAKSGETLVQAEPQQQTIIVSRQFQTPQPLMGMHPGDLAAGSTPPRAPANRYVISIGIHTREFEKAKRQDIDHALFMGALLFLVGSAGLYLAYLYQRVRLAKTTLATMQLYLESIIESIPAGLATLDSQKRIVSCNRNFEKLTNASLAQLTTRDLADVLPQGALPSTESFREHVEVSGRLKGSDGASIPVQITRSQLVDQRQMPIGQVLVVRDMRAIHELERQLERSRRLAALGKMAAGIAHELRNPLGTLRGFSQYFGKHADSTEGKEYAELMVSEVDRLNETISALLQFARPRDPQFKQCSLHELFTRAQLLMASDMKAGEITFTASQPAITLWADPDLLLQVLLNLLQNSIKATDPGGKVSLTATLQGKNIHIRVTDTGRGMTEQVRDHMFDPFFTTMQTGTGLGLAVSHQIIEQHRGSFVVRTMQGQGTTVTVILPHEPTTH